MTRNDAPGWFGKLATHGDFASRRLSAEWVQACDQWLAGCVSTSHRQLGARWTEVYLSAPVWRFAWGPGVFDEQWWFGILMPSCDNVGRYFPLMVVQPRAHAPTDRVGMDHLDLWWQHVARAALDTLSEGATLAAFESALHAGPPWPGPGQASPLSLARGVAGHWRVPVPAARSLGELAGVVAAGDLQQRLARSSFWWPLSPGDVEGTFTLVAGLPPPDAFAQMLSGQW